MDSDAHSLRWWFTKVAAAVLLIALVIEHFLLGYMPTRAAFPLWIGQTLGVSGGLVTLTHYVYVKCHTWNLSDPDDLITEFGLFRYIRHPMYTGDLIINAGLLFLVPGVLSLLIWCVGAVAIWRQALVEDRYVASRFEERHERWRERTFLLLPGL